MNRLQQLLNDASAAFNRLQERERKLVVYGGGGALLALLLLVSLTISSNLSRREVRLKTKLTQLEEVHKLTAGYRAADQERAALEQRLRNNQVRPFSLLEQLAKKQGLDIGGMNDKGTRPVAETKIVEASVEVTFTRIPLEKLVRFLTEVESSAGIVKITKLQIRPRDNEPVIDAWLVVSTYSMES